MITTAFHAASQFKRPQGNPPLNWVDISHEEAWRLPVLVDDRYQKGLIVARRDFTKDLWSIRIRPSDPFPFRAGQYATLGVDLQDRVLERPYSIVSAPDEPELPLFIELITAGALTPHLHRLGEGQTVWLRRRPKGLFLRQPPAADLIHLFCATVTGVAPFASFLRQLVRRSQSEGGAVPRILLLQGASHADEFGYLEEMERMSRDLPGFRYVPTVSRPWDEPGWEGEVGRAEDVLRKHADDFGVAPGQGMVYLCGHPGMIAGGRALMRRRGLQDKEILEEQYWPEGKEPTGSDT